MAFSAITWTSMDDFVTQFVAFAVANGWTQDQLDTAGNEAAIHINSGFHSFSWDESQRLRPFLALGFTGGNSPGQHPNDSGPDSGERIVLWGSSGGTADLFSGTEGNGLFLHAAIEYSPNLFAYLSLGELNKFGTWTGGEYVAAHAWGIGVSPVNDDPFDTRHYVLFDERHGTDGAQGTTVHVEGVDGLPAGGTKWGTIHTGSTLDNKNDRSGTARVRLTGGMRDGHMFNALDYVEVNPINGFVPLQPIQVWQSQGANRLLGFAPGMRGLQIRFIGVREEFTLGADVWKAYPWVRKADTNTGQKESENQGLAFLKVP